MAVSLEALEALDRSQSGNTNYRPPSDAITSNLETVRLKPEDRIFEQEKNIQSFYLVRQGLLGVYRHVYPNKKVLAHKIGRGESAGLAQLMGGSPYPGQLIPIKETVAYVGSRTSVESLCEDCPADVTRLLAEESRVHDDVLQKIDQIIGKDLDNRIATELLDLASRIGKKTGDGFKIIVKLTRKQISEMVGCAQESVIRIMSGWEKKGLIKTEHKYITLLKPQTLRTV